MVNEFLNWSAGANFHPSRALLTCLLDLYPDCIVRPVF